MPMSILFWVLMLLWLVWGAWWTGDYRNFFGSNWLLFVLLLLLGWQVFGQPIR